MKKILITLITFCLFVCVGCDKQTDVITSTDSGNTRETVITDSKSTDTITSTDSTSASNPTNEQVEKTDQVEQANDNPYAHLDFSFVSEDIFGQTISSDIYGQNKLTLVNIFATWCPPCIEELPYLSQLNDEFKEQGFQIIGFVTDTKDYTTSNLDYEAMDAAKALYANADVSYPFIVPDDTFLGGLLFVQYVPTSVFLDNNGKMVGEPIVGANSLEGWRSTITERLNSL